MRVPNAINLHKLIQIARGGDGAVGQVNDRGSRAVWCRAGTQGYLPARLARRGITDLAKVQIDPWPAGTFGAPYDDGRRLARCICYLRDEPTDNTRTIVAPSATRRQPRVRSGQPATNSAP